MKPNDVSSLISQSPNEVWSILLKNGMELVTQMREEDVIVRPLAEQKHAFLLSKPFIVRPIHVPVQNGNQIHVQTTVQSMPLVMKMQQPELPIDADDIWVMTTASKASSDEYLQQTSGILIGKH
jgi:hypothetical protein